LFYTFRRFFCFFPSSVGDSSKFLFRFLFPIPLVFFSSYPICSQHSPFLNHPPRGFPQSLPVQETVFPLLSGAPSTTLCFLTRYSAVFFVPPISCGHFPCLVHFFSQVPPCPPPSFQQNFASVCPPRLLSFFPQGVRIPLFSSYLPYFVFPRDLRGCFVPILLKHPHPMPLVYQTSRTPLLLCQFFFFVTT